MDIFVVSDELCRQIQLYNLPLTHSSVTQMNSIQIIYNYLILFKKILCSN